MPDTLAEARLRAVTSTQLGLFTRDQSRECGVTADSLRWQIRAGRLEQVHSTVFALTGFGWSPARRLLAATLAGGPGSMASHRPGAWLWHLTRYPQQPEISIPRHRRLRSDSIRIHRPLDLPHACEIRMGMPVTDVNRCLIDLGAVVRYAMVRDALDRAIAQRHTTPIRVLAELAELAQRGRRGVGVMRSLLDEAGVTGSHQPSVLEAKTRRLIRRAGLREPDCELVAGANGEYRLDFPWPEAALTLEVDGWMYHSSFDAFHNDRTRQNALTIEGLAFLRYTWLHITRSQEKVVRELRNAYNARTGVLV